MTLIYFNKFNTIYTKGIDDIKPQYIMLEHFRCRFRDETMFHHFESERILNVLLKDVQEQESEEDSNRNKEILLNILYPNHKCENAFD